MNSNSLRTTDSQARRWRAVTWAFAALVLAVPLLAMQFSSGVDWGPEDFIFSAVLVTGLVAVIELTLRMRPDRRYLAATGIALATAFLMLWLAAGVGIIGRDGDPANLLYLGVLAIGILGALLGRARPAGMAMTLRAVAVTQFLVGVLAVATGLGNEDALWPVDVIAATLVFCGLWMLAGHLYAKASE